MKPTLNWCGEWPPEVRDAVEPYLLRWLVILPGWCEEIIVRWNPDCTSSSMRTDVRPEYRDTIFEVCPSWLEMDDARREGTVVHELSHILAGPLVNFTRDIIRNLSEEDTPLRSLLDKQCENAFEGVVEDTGRAFVRMRDA